MHTYAQALSSLSTHMGSSARDHAAMRTRSLTYAHVQTWTHTRARTHCAACAVHQQRGRIDGSSGGAGGPLYNALPGWWLFLCAYFLALRGGQHTHAYGRHNTHFKFLHFTFLCDFVQYAIMLEGADNERWTEEARLVPQQADIAVTSPRKPCVGLLACACVHGLACVLCACVHVCVHVHMVCCVCVCVCACVHTRIFRLRP